MKEHIYIKRRQVNAYHEIKASEINVLGCLQRVSLLKFLIITMLEMTMLSLLPKVPTTIESRLWVACKKLSRWSKVFIKNHTRIFYVKSDGMGSQFRSRYIFKLLASKGPMDGIGGTVNNVILRKVKSGQLVVIFSTWSFWGCDKICSVNSLCIPTWKRKYCRARRYNYG